MAGSPALYFKQLYIGAEKWTVPHVAAKVGYREDKVVGRYTTQYFIDTNNTSSHPDLYALEGLSYTIQELKRSLSEVVFLGRGIDEAASSIGMPRNTFNRKQLTINYEPSCTSGM